MFYQENQINKNLICILCNDRLYEPRVLPCGNVLCNYCYKLLVINQNGNTLEHGLECSLCNEVHELPKNGLQTCELISNLVQEKPYDLYRGGNHANLKHNLNFMDNKIKELDRVFKNGPYEIKEYCYNLCFEIQLTKEVIINELEKKTKLLIDQVSEYEHACVENFENSKNEESTKFKQNFRDVLDEMSSFKNEWSDYIKRVHLDEDSLLKANYQARERVLYLRKQDMLLNSFLFSEKNLRFKKSNLNLEENIQIGYLQKSKIKHINLNKLRKINVRPYFFSAKNTPISNTVAVCLENFYLAFAFVNKRDNLEIFIADKEVRLKSLIVSKVECVEFKLVNSKNNLIVYHHEVVASSVYKLTLFDENLEAKHMIELTGPLDLLAANNVNVFAINSAKRSLIDVYDLNLKFVKRVGQSTNPFNSFFCPKGIKQMNVDDDNYYLLDKYNKLRILDRYHGTLSKTFTISGNKFATNSRDEIISADDINKQITYYKASDGSFIAQLEIVNYAMDSDITIIFDKKCNFMFFDKKQLVYYY